MSKRIVGIDVTRALAIIGMIIVNFKMVFGQQGSSWLKPIVSVFDGKAAATFVVLAGIGIAFMTNTAVKNKDRGRLQIARKKIIKRALLLFVIGLSYILIWPADILHFYGIYMLLTLFFVTRKPKYALWFAFLLILSYPLWMLLLNYDTGWDFTNYSYEGFWTPEGFLRNLFYNGFHPVLPWAAFMLIGLWFGRQNLHDFRFVKKALGVSLLIFILTNLLSKLSIAFLSEGNEAAAKELAQVLGTSPMPPLPIYMLSGSSIAIAIICACILLAKRFENSAVIKALTKTGQLALTFYVAHVLIGMAVPELISSTAFGDYSLSFSFGYALLFSLGCIAFAVLWLRYKKMGPLEWILRKLAN
ncbi:MAG: DUF418 domain-containing protein [Flavobacteriaceae bacterium]|nr:DUF418 domain-containing protein [Flavobacteriaceae bacterium]